MGRLMARRGTAATVSTATTVAIAGAILLVAAFPLFWAVLNSLKHLLDIVTPVPLHLHADARELRAGAVGPRC